MYNGLPCITAQFIIILQPNKATNVEFDTAHAPNRFFKNICACHYWKFYFRKKQSIELFWHIGDEVMVMVLFPLLCLLSITIIPVSIFHMHLHVNNTISVTVTE